MPPDKKSQPPIPVTQSTIKPPALPPPVTERQLTESRPPALSIKPSGRPTNRVLNLVAIGGCLAILGILCLTVMSQLTRSDEPEDFVFLASALFVDLPTDGNAPIKLTAPEEVVKLRKQIAMLDHISRRGETLEPV